MNPKNWSVQSEIKKRVELESLYEWGKNTKIPPFPTFIAVKTPKKNWRYFYKLSVETLRELRP